MNIETMLHEEIASEFQNLQDMEAGSKEYQLTVDGLTKLMDRAIEIERFHAESEEKEKARKIESDKFDEEKKAQKIEQDLKLKQAEDDQKDRLIRNCIAAAGIIIPSMITIWGTFKTIEFEKEGTITTIMGRGFVNKLLPKK